MKSFRFVFYQLHTYSLFVRKVLIEENKKVNTEFLVGGRELETLSRHTLLSFGTVRKRHLTPLIRKTLKKGDFELGLLLLSLNSLILCLIRTVLLNYNSTN